MRNLRYRHGSSFGSPAKADVILGPKLSLPGPITTLTPVVPAAISRSTSNA
jgi:hypothetical protein